MTDNGTLIGGGVPAQAKTRREIYSDYLLSPHWARLRIKAFRIAGQKCEASCGGRCTVGHHLIYRDPLEKCTVSDIMALCWDCHNKFHKWMDSIGKRERHFSRRETALSIQKLNEMDSQSRDRPTKKSGKEKKHGRTTNRSLFKEQEIIRALNSKSGKRSDLAHTLKVLLHHATVEQLREIHPLVVSVIGKNSKIPSQTEPITSVEIPIPYKKDEEKGSEGWIKARLHKLFSRYKELRQTNDYLSSIKQLIRENELISMKHLGRTREEKEILHEFQTAWLHRQIPNLDAGNIPF